MRNTVVRIFIVALLLFTASASFGQIEVSSGIDLTYPVLLNSYNSKLTYSQISFGFGVGVAYKPEETQFFPILKLSGGRTRLPLNDIGKNVVALDFNYMNVMLNENYIVRFPNSELFVYGGIGFSHLAQKGIKVTGSGGEAMKVAIDSTRDITKYFPAMNIGFEYNYGQSAGKDLYLTIGINFQYIMLLSERNIYSFSLTQGGVKNSATVSLAGNQITPGFYLALHYLLHWPRK